MKVKNSRSMIITGRKWYLTSTGEFAYTYLERTLKNRLIKDQIIEQLNKRDITTNVFFKNLSLKGRAEKISSYIIATPTPEFSNIFSNVELKNSNLNFEKIEAEA